jgi:hypothetical protein
VVADPRFRWEEGSRFRFRFRFRLRWWWSGEAAEHSHDAEKNGASFGELMVGQKISVLQGIEVGAALGRTAAGHSIEATLVGF